MKNRFCVRLLFLLAIPSLNWATVDFGSTWAQPVAYGAVCLGNQYYEVGFHVNWEFNNNKFQIQRSKDPNFSWVITGTPVFDGNINGCGTCNGNTYEVNDYGPFLPGETWYYRVKAISNNNNFQYKDIGPVVITIPSIVDWVPQIANSVDLGSSPSTESSYAWANELRDMQGVSVSLMPTEIAKLYLEQHNHKIIFRTTAAYPFFSLEVNVDDNGYLSIYNGTGKTSMIWSTAGNSINNLGQHNLKVKFTCMGGTYVREYIVYTVPKSDKLYVDNFCNTIRVWEGNGGTDAIPLILSEGFDAYNNKAQQYYRHQGDALISCLLKKGFNVYIIDYEYNSQSIFNNAAVYSAAIRFVSNINGGKKVVATGMSMGGLILRFAAAHAESNSNPLPISKLMSLDSPHQGANMSPELQDFKKQQMDKSAQNNKPDPFGEHLSNNDAAKQMLLYNAYDPSGSVRTSFLNTLQSENGDGYPHLVETIGVAFSSNSPNTQSGVWLSIQVLQTPFPDPVPIFYDYLDGNDLLAGSYLPSLAIDDHPLTHSNWWSGWAVSFLRLYSDPVVIYSQNLNPTFVPHTSALDITNGVSKFTTTIIPALTGYHDKIPDELIERIVNALLEKDVFVQNKTYQNEARTVIASDRIYAGANVTSTKPAGDVILDNSQLILKAGKKIIMIPACKFLRDQNY